MGIRTAYKSSRNNWQKLKAKNFQENLTKKQIKPIQEILFVGINTAYKSSRNKRKLKAIIKLILNKFNKLNKKFWDYYCL